MIPLPNKVYRLTQDVEIQQYTTKLTLPSGTMVTLKALQFSRHSSGHRRFAELEFSHPSLKGVQYKTVSKISLNFDLNLPSETPDSRRTSIEAFENKLKEVHRE